MHDCMRGAWSVCCHFASLRVPYKYASILARGWREEILIAKSASHQQHSTASFVVLTRKGNNKKETTTAANAASCPLKNLDLCVPLPRPTPKWQPDRERCSSSPLSANEAQRKQWTKTLSSQRGVREPLSADPPRVQCCCCDEI